MIRSSTKKNTGLMYALKDLLEFIFKIYTKSKQITLPKTTVQIDIRCFVLFSVYPISISKLRIFMSVVRFEPLSIGPWIDMFILTMNTQLSYTPKIPVRFVVKYEKLVNFRIKTI
jgi:hypothetical protein